MRPSLLFLIGYPGCGKSTVGRLSAADRGVPFYDTDALAEGLLGCSVAEAFGRWGEEHFRRAEAQALRQCLRLSAGVVATGGGLPLQGQGMQQMQRAGDTLYLQLPPAVLAQRIGANPMLRPRTAALRGDSLLAFIEADLKAREPVYRQCRYLLPCAPHGVPLTPGEIVQAIAQLTA